MLTEKATEVIRVNARSTDVFDIFNVRQYVGANPYLDGAAVVFDFAFTEYNRPLPIEDYLAKVSERYPRLLEAEYQSHGELFARTVAEVNKLDMELHLQGLSIREEQNYLRIAIESLHQRTTRETIYCVWDWFEAIERGDEFDLNERIADLQQVFRSSVYGGPTVYALLRSANEKKFLLSTCGMKD